MTKGVSKKLQRDEQLRKKRAQAASVLAHGAKVPPKPIVVVAARRSRPSAGRATAMPEPLPPAHYPIKRSSLGKRQAPGGVG